MRLLNILIAASLPLTVAAAQDGNWKLIWGDDFDGPRGSAADPAKWVYDTGATGWGNHELEEYTRDPANAFLDGEGHLVIRAIRSESGKYTSAPLKTLGRFSFQYGRVEARIRIPFCHGLWPAFWMLGENLREAGWPTAGEMDVMENIGKDPERIHGTVHGPGYSGPKALPPERGFQTAGGLATISTYFESIGRQVGSSSIWITGLTRS